MRVFITGAAGLIGRAITTHLLERGHEVRLIDLVKPDDMPDVVVCDMLDFASVQAQMKGCDAVVHMAALRNPFYAPGQDVFRINTVGTFNVYEAAAKEGIKRVVQASSINAIGCAWNIIDFNPAYLPVDEAHPMYTTDPYSFSKEQGESIGDYYWRREGISGTALRFPGVYSPAPRASSEGIARRNAMREFLDAYAALPDAERERQLQLARKHCLQFRAERQLEFPDGKWKLPEQDDVDVRLLQAYTFDRFNLWALLDERDAALSVELSITAGYEGSHPLFINDTCNSLNYDSATLAQLFFEGIPWKSAPNGVDTLVSIQRAHDLIGFEPQHSVRGTL